MLQSTIWLLRSIQLAVFFKTFAKLTVCEIAEENDIDENSMSPVMKFKHMKNVFVMTFFYFLWTQVCVIDKRMVAKDNERED